MTSLIGFYERFDTIDSMISDRNHQWLNALKVFFEYPWGIGIGMLSHITAAQGFELACPDGNYFRILGELGLYGFVVFILLLGTAIVRGLFHVNIFYGLALMVFSLQAIGSNVFDFYYTSFLFWFLVGGALAIYRKNAKKKLIICFPKSQSVSIKIDQSSVVTGVQ